MGSKAADQDKPGVPAEPHPLERRPGESVHEWAARLPKGTQFNIKIPNSGNARGPLTRKQKSR